MFWGQTPGSGRCRSRIPTGGVLDPMIGQQLRELLNHFPGRIGGGGDKPLEPAHLLRAQRVSASLFAGLDLRRLSLVLHVLPTDSLPNHRLSLEKVQSNRALPGRKE